MKDSDSPEREAKPPERRLARAGLALAAWSERWFPDPAVVAFLGVVAVFVLGVLAGEDPGRMAFEGGKGFWALVPFTMQMVMIIVGGHVVASTAVARSAIRWLAGLPATPRSAVAWVALFSMLTSLISWGLSLIYRIPLPSPTNVVERAVTPGEWLEHSPALNILVAALLFTYLVQVFRTSSNGVLAALDLNTYNLIFIAAGLLLHWRPIRFLRAVAESIPATCGVLLQFPFDAMIVGDHRYRS